ncbi:MAG: hypothetical protein ABSD29_11815 [Verrucomicrobiota bacterium]|jgi:hypothetical protein
MKNTKNLRIRPTLRGLVLALAATALSGYVASAHPYASGITNTSGTISFVLNEAADNVGVSLDLGAATNNLGPLTNGIWSFPLNGHNSYAIYVTKTGSGVPSQISPTPTASNFVDFYGPRGVAVNRNPKRHNFGRIYVVNASPGTNLRAVGKGLYVLNANFSDCLGYGGTASPTTFPVVNSVTGAWGSSTTYAPYRLWVGEDDTVYVGDSSGVSTGTTIAGCPVWIIDPDLVTPIEMFAYSGVAGGSDANAGPCQSKPYITGSLATSDLTLTCLMWNYVAAGGTYQSVLQYPINSGPINSSTPWTGTPNILVTNSQYGFLTSGGLNGVGCDLVGNPTNNSLIYVCYYRSGSGGWAAGNQQLAVYNVTAASPVYTNFIWGSADPATGGVGTGGVGAGANDCFAIKNILPYGMAISPDGQYLGFGNESYNTGYGFSSALNIFCIVKLTNGIPDNSTIATYAAPSYGQRGAAFDLADNFYTVDGNSDSLRCYSLGFTTTCVTSNDASAANGSFWMVLPSSTVSVKATSPNASQGNPTPVPGVFQLTRSGQLTAQLYVNFTLGGTASNSTYTVSGAGPGNNNVTFAMGASTTNITITPTNDSVARLTTTVVLSLAGGTNYSAVAPVQDTVLIQNTAEPQLVLSAGAPTAYKRFTNDYASVTITRLGNTNVALSLSPSASFTYVGSTATLNTDYALLGSTAIPAGTLTATAKILSPLNPPEPVWVGDKKVVVTLGSNGSTYTNMPGSASQTLTILDDKYPPAPVLWSDPLTNTISGPNNSDGAGQWNIAAVGRDNGAAPPDYTLDWGYNLVTDLNGYGLIPLPPNGFTNALRATFNKVHGGVSGAVNLYPTNVTFSGNYAVRFQMYAAEGGMDGGVGGGTVTEGPMFGIDHNGLETNWWAGSAFTGGPWASDGVWYWMSTDPGGSANGDYIAFTGVTNSYNPAYNTGWQHPNPALFWTSFTNAFKNPQDFTTVGATTNAVPGIPANASWSFATTVPSVPTTNANWADVEIKQVNNVVTLSIDKTVIFTYVNTNSLFQQGTLMLGYEDPYDSTGDSDAGAFFSNVQVVRLGVPAITGITASGGFVTIQFISFDGDDTTASFTLQSCATVNGTYSNVSPAATFTQNPANGVFQTVYPQNGNARFYRIQQCSSCGD